MITFTRSYKTQDGQVFGTIEEAQEHELGVAFEKHPLLTQTGLPPAPMNQWIAKMVLESKEVVMDILTMTPNSKPKARSIHGGTKKRNVKSVVTDANVTVASTTNT